MRSRSQPAAPDRDHVPTRARGRSRPAVSGARPVVQTKLTLGPPGDRYEREADSVAKQVMASLDGPIAAQRQPEEEELMASRVQRQPDEEELMASRVQRQGLEEELMASRIQRQPEEEEELLQGKLQLKGIAEPGPVDPAIESQIQGARAGGQPLDAGVRASMEGAFGADFGGVRVHTGQAADDLNSSLQARAFTTGRDIFFRQGDYDPGSRGGQELIAHELTHVVQQGG